MHFCITAGRLLTQTAVIQLIAKLIYHLLICSFHVFLKKFICKTHLSIIEYFELRQASFELAGGVDGCRPRWIPACKAGAFADSLRPHKLDAFLAFRSKLLSYRYFFTETSGRNPTCGLKTCTICCLHLKSGCESRTRTGNQGISQTGYGVEIKI